MRLGLIAFTVVILFPRSLFACATDGVFAVSIVERLPVFTHNIMRIGETVRLPETDVSCHLSEPTINRKAIETDPRIKYSTSIKLTCSTPGGLTFESYATWEQYTSGRTYLTQSAEDTGAGIWIRNGKKSYNLSVFCLAEDKASSKGN